MDKRLAVPSVLGQEYEHVPVDLIQPHDRNVNQGDLGKICESIHENGFYGACIVQRSTRRILAGCHRWMAAKQAKMAAVPVIWVDVDDETALRIMLSDNATARAGLDNPAALADLLKELAEAGHGLSGTGYDGDFLDDLLNDLSRPADFSGLNAPKAAPEKEKPDRIEREKPPRIPHEADEDKADRDRDADEGREEKTRLGVVVICDSEGDQDHIYHKLVDLGWCPSKTEFSEQSFARLRGEG